MMKLLQEMKGVGYTHDQIVYYGYQQHIRSARSRLHNQPTIADAFRRQELNSSLKGGGDGAHGPVKPLTRKVRLYVWVVGCCLLICCVPFPVDAAVAASLPTDWTKGK